MLHRLSRCASALIVVLIGVPWLSAQESLKLVPADAQVYSATLNASEQIEAILKSRAWAKLNSLPFMKLAWASVEKEWARDNGGLADLRRWYEQPENRELVQLGLDMLSQEVFTYGGRNSAEFLTLLQQMQTTSQLAPLLGALQGDDIKEIQDPENRLREVLYALADDPKLIVVPNFVIGFKLSDTKIVKAQLQRLEPLLALAAQLEPKLKDRLKKTTIAGGEFHVLHLDGTMVPWNEVPLRKFERQAGDFDDLVDRLKSLKLTFSFGLRDSFFLIALGESTEVLETLGTKPLLAGRPEFKKLAQHAGKKLSTIAFASKEWNAKTQAFGGDTGDYLEELLDNLKNSTLPEEKQKKLKADIRSWVADLNKFTPEHGASLTLAFLTATGEEAYNYDWTKNSGWDSSKPLTILQYVGGTPLLVAAGRTKSNPEEYQTLVKVIKSAHQAFEEYGLPMLGEEVQEQYKKALAKVAPLLQRLDKATGEMLIPALADGQAAFVLDAKLKSKQWHNALPETEKPLAMLEPALVIGVSDADLLRKACAEYFAIINDALAQLVEFAPNPVELKLPPPQTKENKNGTLYYYEIPAEAGLDKKLAPTAGLGKNVAVLTISNQHASRLLAAKPFKPNADVPLDTSRPLAAAVYIDFPGLVDAIVPWAEFAMKAASADEEVVTQVRVVLPILQVFRGFSSVSYLEEGVLVTHSRTVVKDIEP